MSFYDSCGACMIIVWIKELIMKSYVNKGLKCNFWNYEGIKCKSDMFDLCDFYLNDMMCIFSFVTPQLIKMIPVTLKHVLWPNKTLISETDYK